MYGPVLTTPLGERIPVNAEAAAELGPASTLNVATTSSAVSVWPLWNLTPLRIWNVQTVAVAFGFQLVASHGWSLSFGSENVRNSPTMRGDAEAAFVCQLARLGRLGRGEDQPTRSVPPALHRAVARVAPRLRRGAEQPADPGRQAEHGAAPEKVPPVELAREPFVDEVVLDRPRLVRGGTPRSSSGSPCPSRVPPLNGRAFHVRIVITQAEGAGQGISFRIWIMVLNRGTVRRS